MIGGAPLGRGANRGNVLPQAQRCPDPSKALSRSSHPVDSRCRDQRHFRGWQEASATNPPARCGIVGIGLDERSTASSLGETRAGHAKTCTIKAASLVSRVGAAVPEERILPVQRDFDVTPDRYAGWPCITPRNPDVAHHVPCCITKSGTAIAVQQPLLEPSQTSALSSQRTIVEIWRRQVDEGVTGRGMILLRRIEHA